MMLRYEKAERISNPFYRYVYLLHGFSIAFAGYFSYIGSVDILGFNIPLRIRYPSSNRGRCAVRHKFDVC